MNVTVSAFGDGTGADLTDGTTTFSNISLSTMYTFGPYAVGTAVDITTDASGYGGCSSTQAGLSGCGGADVCSSIGPQHNILGNSLPGDLSTSNVDAPPTLQPAFLSCGNGTTLARCGGITHNAYYYTDYSDLGTTWTSPMAAMSLPSPSQDSVVPLP